MTAEAPVAVATTFPSSPVTVELDDAAPPGLCSASMFLSRRGRKATP